LPPCRPASPFVSVSPSVASPTTPTIGFAGKRTRSFISIQPSSTRNMRVTGRLDLLDQLAEARDQAGEAELDRPHVEDLGDDGSRPARRRGRPPGPVALLIRSRSMSVTRSSSDVICPVKQSFVSKVTVSPGSTSSTGWRSGPNDQITWLRGRELLLRHRQA
jgi:hypothetical protein